MTTQLQMISLLLWAVCFLPLAVGAAGVQKTIKFASGTSSGVVEESVLRGDRDVYHLQAKAGQKMAVRITAVENNAAFVIYRPGCAMRTTGGMAEMQGSALSGAGELDDATTWNGVLPSTGKYCIVVGSTRGNATYRLGVEIR